jgi:formate dehydrogenase iron-sulfur subunit
MSKYGMLIDTTMCIGCKGCSVACKQWNELPAEITQNRGTYQNPLRLSASTWTNIEYREIETGDQLTWVFFKRACMHCEHPACASACPVGALHKTEAGSVIYDDQKCIGCRYCIVACPVGVPTFQWDKGLLAQPLIRKCKFCFDRVSQGIPPACSKTCPSGAILFGEREQLLAEAERRIANSRAKYINHVYGKEEAGGTSILYLSSVPFEQLGLPKLDPRPIPALSEAVMGGTVPFALAWTAVLAGIYGLVRLRERGKPKTGEPGASTDREKEASQ